MEDLGSYRLIKSHFCAHHKHGEDPPENYTKAHGT